MFLINDSGAEGSSSMQMPLIKSLAHDVLVKLVQLAKVALATSST